ncbi:MAG: trypsin-like peptidase domain-containing protein [Thiotrichaceae bacterium]|nr:trypsin-like peptidase domain-containing protein [Thiotrichaceae bacterium]
MSIHFANRLLSQFVLITIFLVPSLSLQAEELSKSDKEAASNNQKQQSIKEAVVKIIVVSHEIDKKAPWNSSIQRGSGSGFIIDGQRILTNAHVISNSTFIEVKKQFDTQRYEAEVEVISHDADLAILKLKEVNKDFFDVDSLTFSSLPKLQEEVTAYGYPSGGSGLSITKGVVSRIERSPYVHKGKQFISVQIDAAINPGNSGGPVLSDGKVVGVVMQSQMMSQSIGYMIPVPVINHFLHDIKDGKYDGYPSLGIDLEETRSPAMRAMYGLNKKHSGVLVTLVYPNSPTEGKLKKNDIITAIDGRNITSNAKAVLRDNEMITFNHYVDMHQLGESIVLDILRDGKELKLDIVLTKTEEAFSLVGGKQFEKPPSYFIYGGFVFMPLTTDYIAASKSRFSSGLDENITVLSQFWPTKKRSEAVILSKVLPDHSNKGFHQVSDFLVQSINGEPFADFNTFYKIFRESKSNYIVLEDQFGYQVVINREMAFENQKKILQRYRITAAVSEDLVKADGGSKVAVRSSSKDSKVLAKKTASAITAQ